MLMKIGVNVTDIEDRLYDILPIVEACIKFGGSRDSIITSANEEKKERFGGKRNVLIVDIKRIKNLSWMCQMLEGNLSTNYNIVKDWGLIRIKWDPKKREHFKRDKHIIKKEGYKK